MKKQVRFAALLLLLALLLPACGGAVPEKAEENYAIPVLLRAQSGLHVTGENPVSAAPGGNAVFTVSLDAGFRVRESDRYSYADGLLTVYNVRYPATVEVGLDFDQSVWGGLDLDRIPTEGSFSYSVQTDGAAYGSVTHDLPYGEYDAATEITVTAEPCAGGRFVCWSLGASVADGGTPLALTEQYTFYLGGETVLYANFASDVTATLLYDANGGETAEGRRYLRSDAQVDFYYYPHALPAQGQMRREGYVLYAYNTAPDGSGIQYIFGSNVLTPESGTMMLYAQWAPVAPSVFTYTVENGEAHITGCSSAAEWLVLPETLDGYPVTEVCAGAIADLAEMTTLVSNPNIKSFANRSVERCPNFTTMYLCDSIAKISDNFYQDCPEFRQLYLGAVRNPTRTRGEAGTFHIKFQRLMQARESDKNMIVVLSGSSSYYGFITPTFDQWMEGEYYIVNYGTSVQLPALFFLEMFSHFADEGDIIIQAPEYSEYQLGDFVINDFHWNCFESALEIFSYVDIRNYRNIFTTLSAFNRVRDKQKEYTYGDHSELVDRYGDQGQFKALNPPTYVYGSASQTFSTSLLSDRGAARLNAAYAVLHEKGAKVYLSFAPINCNALADVTKTAAHQQAYAAHLQEKLIIPVISSPGDYILEGQYFYNSDYHTGTRGAEIRTKQLAEDLIAQLKKEKKP